MWYVYIIRSFRKKYKYIGFTSDWQKRLIYHNKGFNRSTRVYRPFKLIYLKSFVTKQKAIKFENKLKSYKSGIALENIINSWDAGVVNRSSL